MKYSVLENGQYVSGYVTARREEGKYSYLRLDMWNATLAFDRETEFYGVDLLLGIGDYVTLKVSEIMPSGVYLCEVLKVY
jgi:hypothetical protein